MKNAMPAGRQEKLKLTLKKILITFSVLFFAFFILSYSIFNASAQTLAAKKPVLKFTVSPSVTPLPSPKPEIQYYLPYPGILPDHPLYPLKMVRDRIWLWLTTNSLRKVEVLLLFADKRLGAGKALIEGNKVSLGLTTIEKAEKYLERAVNQLEREKTKGPELGKLGEKLKTASQKHEEIIAELKENLTGDTKVALENLLVYPKTVLEKVQKILE